MGFRPVAMVTRDTKLEPKWWRQFEQKASLTFNIKWQDRSSAKRWKTSWKSIRVYFRTTRRKADPQVDTDGLFVRLSCDGFRQLSKVSYDSNGIRKDGHRIPWYNILRFSLSLGSFSFGLKTSHWCKFKILMIFCCLFFFYLYPGLYSVKKKLVLYFP